MHTKVNLRTKAVSRGTHYGGPRLTWICWLSVVNDGQTLLRVLRLDRAGLLLSEGLRELVGIERHAEEHAHVGVVAPELVRVLAVLAEDARAARRGVADLAGQPRHELVVEGRREVARLTNARAIALRRRRLRGLTAGDRDGGVVGRVV